MLICKSISNTQYMKCSDSLVIIGAQALESTFRPFSHHKHYVILNIRLLSVQIRLPAKIFRCQNYTP